MAEIIYNKDAEDTEGVIVGQITLDPMSGLHEVCLPEQFRIVAILIEGNSVVCAYAEKR